MIVSAIGIKNLFEFLGTMGTTIRNLLGQNKLTVNGGVEVKLTVQLAPELEELIKDIITSRNSTDDPPVFFRNAVQELIKGSEEKFRTLSQLNVTDVTLGTEAIYADSVPEEMAEVFVQYARLYILTPSPDEVFDQERLPPALTEVFETLHSSQDENDQPLTVKFGTGKVRPHFEPPERKA